MPFDFYNVATVGMADTMPYTSGTIGPYFFSCFNSVINPNVEYPLYFAIYSTKPIFIRQRRLNYFTTIIPDTTVFTDFGLTDTNPANGRDPIVVTGPVNPTRLSAPYEYLFEPINTLDYGLQLQANVYWPITVNGFKDTVIQIMNLDYSNGIGAATNNTGSVSIACLSDISLNKAPATLYSLGFVSIG